MQTFLPHPSFRESASCLDDRRLGNQAYRECVTLIRGGWPNHPASRMWRGHEHALALYALACLAELDFRGRRYEKWFDYFYTQSLILPDHGPPPWLGDERLHSSHRANLLRKDPAHYGQFGWTETPATGYWWPNQETSQWV